MASQQSEWSEISQDERFLGAKRRKARFMVVAGLFMAVYYFSMPMGAAYVPDAFKVRVWKDLNTGLLFAVSQYVVTWILMVAYARYMRSVDAQMSSAVRDRQKSPQLRSAS